MYKNRLKELVFSNFDGGINASVLRSKLSDNELYECVNMYLSNGSLTTRDGIVFKENLNLSDRDIPFTLKPLSPLIYTSENALKLFLLSGEKEGIFYNKLLLINTDNEIKCISLISCNSENYDFSIENINGLCFNGKEIYGSGIFVVISLIDVTGEVCDKFIYELSKDLSRANTITNSDIYAPLVYANGRGASYSDLPVSKRTFPAPRMLEDFNAFSSGFRVAYTTDGISSYFYLPTKNLTANNGENIKIAYTDANGIEYTWNIPYNASASNYIEISEAKLSFSINRSMGELYLHNNLGEDAALPMSEGIYNNLVVTAYKAPDDDSLFKMTVSENFNSRVFLSGNSEKGNVVCFSKQNNPLYFPKSNIAYFGDKTANVTAIKQLNDRLVIFKAHQVGLCSSVKAAEYNVESVLDGLVTRASTDENMEIKTINTGIGCVYPHTILNCANRLVFLGSDKRVYTVTSSSNYLQRFYRISDKIESVLSIGNETDEIFALDYDGKYMLFTDNICYLFDYNTTAFLSSTSSGSKKQKDNIGWFYLNYNFGVAKPFFAMCNGDNVIISAKCENGAGITDVVLFGFGGIKDQKMTSATEFEEVDIYSKLSTKTTSFSYEGNKKIVGIEAVLVSSLTSMPHPISIYYNDENKSVFITSITPSATGDENEYVMRITPCIFGVRHFGISMERNSAFSVKQIKFTYKTV